MGGFRRVVSLFRRSHQLALVASHSLSDADVPKVDELDKELEELLKSEVNAAEAVSPFGPSQWFFCSCAEWTSSAFRLLGANRMFPADSDLGPDSEFEILTRFSGCFLQSNSLIGASNIK